MSAHPAPPGRAGDRGSRAPSGSGGAFYPTPQENPRSLAPSGSDQDPRQAASSGASEPGLGGGRLLLDPSYWGPGPRGPGPLARSGRLRPGFELDGAQLSLFPPGPAPESGGADSLRAVRALGRAQGGWPPFGAFGLRRGGARAPPSLEA